MEPALMDAVDAGRYLHISRSKVYGLIQAGELRGVKVGRRRLFSRGELDRFIARLEAVAADNPVLR